jgi:hypothetical protein
MMKENYCRLVAGDYHCRLMRPLIVHHELQLHLNSVSATQVCHTDEE